MPVVLTDPLANNKTCILSDSIFDTSAYVGLGEDELNPAMNAVNDSTFDFWRNGSSSANTTLRKSGATPRSANALGISGHNLATTASTIRLRRSVDAVSWVDVIAPYSPLTDEDIFFIFPIETNNYWEVLFGTSTSAYVSNVKLGVRLTFPFTPIEGYRPVHHSRKFTKYFNNSIEGHLLGNRVMSSGGTTTVEFPDVPRDFVDGSMRNFEDHYNRGRPFFYAGWPNGKPQDVAYAWADSEDAMIDVAYTNGSKRASVGFGMSIKYGR